MSPVHKALLMAVCLLFPAAAQAETCLRACFSDRHLPSDVSDEGIRAAMKSCRDQCTGATDAELRRTYAAMSPAKCHAEPISEAEFKQLRSASASFVVQSNTFTWDLHNVLPGRLIREVVVVTQSLDLADVELTGATLIPPGDTETVIVTGFFDGYPTARFATKIRAIYACTLP